MIDPRTPVLVGVGAVSTRAESLDDAMSALDLMALALERSAEGTTSLLPAIDVIMVPEGTWLLTDPGRLLAARVGASARTLLAEIGVLQSTLFTRAAELIARGDAEVVAIVGGEAKHRDRLLTKAGLGVDEDRSPGTAPDETLAPDGDILSMLEIERDLAVPAQQYAVIENALRVAAGLSIDDHRHGLAELWAGFSAVAVGNPNAWNRDPVLPGMLADGGAANPTISSPYTRLHCSQWNVDQAGAVIMCSVDAARRFGVATERWVYPYAAAESNTMIPLTQRAELGACPAFGMAGFAVASHIGVALADVEQYELYSCFPSAVQIQARELGLDADRPLTLSGGMGFAGGPLNNFTLQAFEPFVARLREQPSDLGLVTAISGMITKQGVGVWSATPPERPFASFDVSAEARAETATVEVDAGYEGPATVESSTVVHQGGVPWRAVVLARTPSGSRAVVRSDDPGIAASLVTDEWTDREIHCVAEWFEV